MPAPNARNPLSRAWPLTAAALMLLPLVLAALGATSAAAAPEAGWGTPELLEHDNGANARDPSVGVDLFGNAIALWRMNNGSGWAVWASRFTPEGGWGAAQKIGSGPVETNVPPSLAVNAYGEALAVWAQRSSPGAYPALWAARYSPKTGWQGAQNVSDEGPGYIATTRVALSANGDGMAVWEKDFPYENIYAARMTSAGGWEPPLMIEAEPHQGLFPDVAIDDRGTAVVVWQQQPPPGGNESIKFNLYTPGVGWGTDAFVETDDTGAAWVPRVVFTGGGTAIAVWEHDNWPVKTVWSAEYFVGLGWGPAERIDSADEYMTFPRLAADGQGDVVAVWQSQNGSSGAATVYANQKFSGSPWSGMVPLGAGSVGTCGWECLVPNVAMDAFGEAFVVWSRTTGAFTEIKSSRFTFSVGWTTDEPVETMNEGGATQPVVGVDPGGNGVAVWVESDGVANNLWSNRYQVPDVSAPTLYLTSPVNGLATDKPTVLVEGVSELGASVTVNGIQATVSVYGTFGVTVALTVGNNTINATAVDAWGNRASVERVVQFVDPMPALQEELAGAIAAASAAEAAADAAVANATAAQANASAAQENATAAAGHFADAQAALARAEAEIQAGASYNAEQNATVAELRTQLATTAALLNETQIRIAQNQTGGGPGGAAGESPVPLIFGLLGAILGAASLAITLMRRPPKGPVSGGGAAPSGDQEGGRLAVAQQGAATRLEPPKDVSGGTPEFREGRIP